MSDTCCRTLDTGITNIEMEGPEFAAFCHHLDIPAILLCVTLLNRIKGDQVRCSSRDMALGFSTPLTEMMRLNNYRSASQQQRSLVIHTCFGTLRRGSSSTS